MLRFRGDRILWAQQNPSTTEASHCSIRIFCDRITGSLGHKLTIKQKAMAGLNLLVGVQGTTLVLSVSGPMIANDC